MLITLHADQPTLIGAHPHVLWLGLFDIPDLGEIMEWRDGAFRVQEAAGNSVWITSAQITNLLDLIGV